MTDGIFTHVHRVTYSECTAGNHVYYGRFLDMLEEARGEFFRHVGQPFILWQEQDTVFPVVECRLRYRAQAHYDDGLTIQLWLAAMERVRFSIAARILNQHGREILLATTDHACTSIEGKPRRLPEPLRTALAPYLHGEMPLV